MIVIEGVETNSLASSSTWLLSRPVNGSSRQESGPPSFAEDSHSQSRERRSWATALEESGRFDPDGLSVHPPTDLAWRGVGVVGGIGWDSKGFIILPKADEDGEDGEGGLRESQLCASTSSQSPLGCDN